MEALNLNTKRLRASEFPDPADVYVCDKCGRDITAHLGRGQSHVWRPLGPLRYVCPCGQKYLSGAVEWDNLSDWEKRQRSRQTLGLLIIISAILTGFGIFVYFAVTRHNLLLLLLSALASIPSIVFLGLLVASLFDVFGIAASLWRTRIGPIVRRS
jgi:hypothetical protein